MPAVVAVDLGGTTIKGAVVDVDGTQLRELSRATPAAAGPDAVVAEALAVISELVGSVDSGEVDAIGVVVPGVVDSEIGRAVFSANLGFQNVPLREIIHRTTGLPTLLEHDVRAAGVAERTVGVTVGVDDCLVAVIGTGIAAVIQIAGRAVQGAGGIAGELGHIPVWPGGEQCACGQLGCLERYSSAAAVARRYSERSGRAGVSAREVVAMAADDDCARAVWAEATEALAIAFTTCTLLLDPQMIVLAGGLSAAGDAILTPVQHYLDRLLTWREPPPLRISPLGARAGLTGAAVLAWQLVAPDLVDFSAWREKLV